MPWIAPTVEEIDFTLPASTCCKKYGLNGTVTRGCPDEFAISKP